MLCRKSTVQISRGTVPVYLNVYDLASINGYAYWFGLGVYHSGVQVYDVEYAFGAHEYSTTGIFEGEPKHFVGFTFRKSIFIGWTEMTRGDVRKMMQKLAEKYRGDAYNLISQNCNHFCNEACVKLTGNQIPSWINRLARIGNLCKCIIPVDLNNLAILNRQHHHKTEDDRHKVEEKKKIRKKSKRLSNNSSSCSSLSSSSCSPPPPPVENNGS